MNQDNEKIKVNDRRINYDDDVPPQEQEQGHSESQAKKIERKKAADDYSKVSAKEESPMPKVDFFTFVLSLSSSAIMHLGEFPEQEGGEPKVNLPMAKQTIDILTMLEEKTKGNLTKDEEKILKDLLFECRMKYVQKSN